VALVRPAACLALVLTILGLLVASNALPSPPSVAFGRPAGTSTVKTVERLLKGIPQSGSALGDADAPVTLQVFGDLECPVCRLFALGALPGLIRHDVRARKLKVEYRSLETATREPRIFVKQQVAALAAGRQDKLWYFVELFYREQGLEGSGYVTERYLDGIARQVPGLNLAAWSAARGDPLLSAEVAHDERAALRRGFEGTPAFLIGRTGGRLRPLEGDIEEAPSFEAAVGRLLRPRR
jgi:protein-disulfide isomerase